MNFYSYKITESENNFYVYVVSLFDDPNYTMETFEHYVANSPQIPLCQYFNTCDFDEMKIEKVAINPVDILNKNLPADNHCANISQDFIALIPPPKEKV